MDVATFFGLFAVALTSTAALSAVGLAGGTIIVPSLIIIFGIESRYAAGTTILAILFGIFSATLVYLKQKRVDIRLALLFDTLDILGVAMGSYVTILISSIDLAFLLGIFLVFISFQLLKWEETIIERSDKKRTGVIWKRKIVDRDGKPYEYSLTFPQLLLSQVASFFSGVSTGLFGIGGGTVDTTIMILIGVPPHIAVATAIFGMMITKVAGVISHYMLGNILLDCAIPLICGSVVGGQIGPRISKRMKPKLLKKILGVVMIMIALRLIIPSIIRL